MSTPPPVPAPQNLRWLYLHGFASGPDSTKGVAVAKHYEAQGIHVERLNLRVPSMEQLRLSAMLDTVREAIGGAEDRAVLFGSSLGGLTAARVAEQDPRVCALVLLAPAFRVVDQLHRRMGDAAWKHWQTSGFIETDDFAEKRKVRIHSDFIPDAEAVDARTGGWPDVRVPTLIIHGSTDDTCNIEYSRQWARGRRHVRLVEVKDGHELTASLPRITAESDDFLRAWGTSPRSA
ncbi:alpha/beta fold hydrolase [Pyxidicoccus fallax]|uniref:Alpha/beta fold hydrolase n=1 Tax=Pyxidicoccus fallax TaxID=394095 RepID=A0A848LSQ8_9BACT|nr:YqiA/YcfP family alpha/beta fold hydrolase [Pyxidicoccus fallax]NMO20975.1 alpha/beta fold hydrolase [Pyxidicoccus fallax]NPC83576.1 alpha/beta fold hydrolase [Pyxidicoccus fallax]